MPALEIHQFMCLKDNFGVLIHDPASNLTASIDAPEAGPIRTALAAKGWKLTHILVTHHHADHTQGIQALKAETGCTVIGPKGEATRIPTLDKTVGGGDKVSFGGHSIEVIDTPGHTAGHITYWIAERKVAFVGDTLFAIGCGRVIEGTPEMMWQSLSRLAALPRETMIYCGHEYTASNARFALTIEPDNTALQARAAEVERLLAAGDATLPTRLDHELETNPFLRPQNAAIRKRLGMEGAADWQVFAEIRERKNRS
ncbi:MAG: hydroxyacylglutathione hydrolase [Hyphomicrobiaceae bacterium]|nr:hydroxyacylglutathione hydrolase [Hyphomicrobiaceae bacterium]